MGEYLTIGFVMWLVMNMFGARMGVETILVLPIVLLVIVLMLV